MPNANFTEAWLAKNAKTDSFAPGLKTFMALKNKAPAHSTNGAVPKEAVAASAV